MSTTGKRMVRLTDEAAALLDGYIASLGPLAPLKNRIASEAVLAYLKKMRKGGGTLRAA